MSAARTASSRSFAASPLVLALACLGVSGGPALAGTCSLLSPATWALGADGDWSTGASWSGGAFPNSASTNVCITDGASTVTLDVSATVGSLQIATGNKLTTGLGANLTVAGSQIIDAGNFNINAGQGHSTILKIGADASLTGGNSTNINFTDMTLNPNDGNGAAYVRGAGHTLTIASHNGIQGSGFIGDDGLAIVMNHGTIEANNATQALSLNAGNGGVTYTGRILALNGATLNLYNTFTSGAADRSGGGIIAANGGTVKVDGTIIGGILAIVNGGTMGTFGSATLDGVTLESNFPFQVVDPYTADFGTSTTLKNTITNTAALQVNGGSGHNTFLYIGNATLSGGGTVTLNPTDGNGAVYVRGVSSNTLANSGNLIQGSGFIGDDGLNFVNGPFGSLLANGSVGTLNVGAGGGTFTNNGTVKVASGSTLKVTADANGFVQSQVGGTVPTTEVDGSLMAPHGVNIQAGLLEGNGTITGNVVSAGTVHPGNSPGILTIIGNYEQRSSGIFAVTLAGLTPGTGYSQLQVGGSAALDGTLAVSLASDFILAVNDTFQIMDFGSSTGDFTAFDFNGQDCSSAGADLWSCGSRGLQFQERFIGTAALDLVVTSVAAGPVPELATWGMMLIGFGLVGLRLRQPRWA